MIRTMLASRVSGWLVGFIAAAITHKRAGRRRAGDRLLACDLDAWGGL